MKNKEHWKPTKFLFQNSQLRGSNNPDELSVASRLSADNTAQLLETYLRKYASGVLFDLGCGKVPLYEIYKDYVSSVICTDWSESLHDNNHWDFVSDISNPLPIVSKSADTVVLSSVLEHISQPGLLIREIHRVLKVNGFLVIAVPFLYRIHEEPWDYFRYTRYGLEKLFADNGFSITEIQETGGIVEIVCTLVIQFLYRRNFAFFFKAVYWLCKSFSKLPCIHRISQKSSEKYPLGYVMVVRKKPWID